MSKGNPFELTTRLTVLESLLEYGPSDVATLAMLSSCEPSAALLALYQLRDSGHARAVTRSPGGMSNDYWEPVR